jgi:pimeloyl-ACP methyl ester carboxylesterase
MTIPQFKIGYYNIHPDVGLNYQMNRFSDGSEQMLNEMREVVPRIHSYADYIKEFLALSEKAYQQGQLPHAAGYLRSAEFFMFPDDGRKDTSRLRFVQWMKEYYQVRESQHFCIPYENITMNTYRFTPESPIGTIVFFGGYDSYIEELFVHQLYFFQHGFDVITFDGPGQGATLEEQHLPMTHEWHKPCKAVLDYFKLNDVTLIGYSLGGCLAIRAAAFEPRIMRVVCDDIVSDFREFPFRTLAPVARFTVSTLVKLGASFILNPLISRKMGKNLTQEWGVKQGMHTLGAKSPFEFFKKTGAFETHSVSHLVNQDVLLFAGSEDHYVPLHQFYDQIQTLKNVRSLTARLFTEKEQAQNHVQVGNTELSLQTIVRWITGLQQRDKQMGLKIPSKLSESLALSSKQK